MRVSVVINTLNRCESLQLALGGLRRQTFRDFEVIVVNGPSTDETQAMLEQSPDPVRIVRCPEACLGVSRNIGIDLAAGSVVAFLDDDAIPEPGWLDALVERYADPGIDAVGGPVFDVALDEVVWQICTSTRHGQADTSSAGPIARYQSVGADPFLHLPGSNMSFRREALIQVGGFNSLLRYTGDDVEIAARLIDRGHGFAVLDEALVRHDRAPNAGRDDTLRLLDPYPHVFCHAVFSSHCEHAPPGGDDVVRETVADLISGVSGAVQAGAYTEEESRWFAERATQAIEDGLSAGAQPRGEVMLSAPEPDAFRPFCR